VAKSNAQSRTFARQGYREIAAIIQDWARMGRYRPGDRIPTEAELCASFGVARVTIRRALAVLVQDGMLETRQGAGTFIARAYKTPPSEVDVKLVGPRPGQWGKDNVYTFIREQHVQPTADERKRLDLTADQTLTEFAYVRIEATTPVEYTTFRYVDWVVNLIEDRSEGVLLHLNAYLGERGVRTGGMHRMIGATSADEMVARLLQIAVGAPLLRQRSVVRDQFDRPYLLVEALSRADKYEMGLDIAVARRPAQHQAGNVSDVVGLWSAPKHKR
jgi:GntR family transcriptional regulator